METRVFRAAAAVFLVAGVLAAMGISGCGGASTKASSVPQESVAGAYDVYREETAVEALTSDTGGRAEYFGEAAKDSGVKSEGTAENGAEGAAQNDAQDGAKRKTGRKLIRTVDMDVETDGFDELLSGITERIKVLGGYVETSDISGRRVSYQNEPVPRNAFLTVRIPSEQLDQFVTSVEEQGNVINKSENTQDVTLQYSDLESRKKSLSIEQERLWALLEKADTLEAVIALEARLSEIRYELESMESQLRLYDNQVDYSTVTVRIREVDVFTPTSPENVGQRISTSFSRNLDSVSRFFTTLFVVLISGIPIWGPILIVILLVLFLTGKRRRKIGEGYHYEIPSDGISDSTGGKDESQPPKTL